MSAEFGQMALITAFMLALVQMIFPLWGARKDPNPWLSLGKSCALGQCGFILISFICLLYALMNNDFSVAYVVHNSSTTLPMLYRIGALWGGHEGSLLLWVFMLSLWTAAVALFASSTMSQLQGRVLGVLGFISAGFLLFLLVTSNPFARFFQEGNLAGQDLNPMLQDPGLLFHPPMLYAGYVGFSVVFAFAIAALLGGDADRAWASAARPWALLAWLTLTLGIVLGSWWAYHELGWGGWWFWDPVENASFLPWLTGTALIHSLIATAKRGVLKSWSVLLAILCFALSLLGTFLVRSGVLISVHAFANDPSRGAFLLNYLSGIILGSFLLYSVRAHRLKPETHFDFISRETALLTNNVLLLVLMGTVLLGTLYPLLLDVLNAGKISVGVPYFNRVFVPLALPLLFGMGLGVHCFWQQMSSQLLWQKVRYSLLAAIIFGIAIGLMSSTGFNPMLMVGLGLAAWILLTTLLTRFWVGKHLLGMGLAHIGIAVTVIGVTMVSQQSEERDVRMMPNESIVVAGYEFTLQTEKENQGPNYLSRQVDFAITKNKKPVATLQAEKRFYDVSRMAMTEAAILPGVFRDLYIALGEPLPQGAWSVRIYYKPFIRWIWFGGGLMALGALVSLIMRKKRD